MRARAATPRCARSRGVSHRCIRSNWKRHLVNCGVTDCPVETARAPTNTLLALDNEKSNTRRKRRRPVDQYLQDSCLRILLVDFGDGRFNDGHVA